MALVAAVMAFALALLPGGAPRLGARRPALLPRASPLRCEAPAEIAAPEIATPKKILN